MVRKYAPDNSRDFHANAHVQCAYEGCNDSSMVKIKAATGWANMCMRHYDAHFAQQAAKNLRKWGMERFEDEPKADHIARMREFVKTGFKRMSMRTA